MTYSVKLLSIGWITEAEFLLRAVPPITCKPALGPMQPPVQ